MNMLFIKHFCIGFMVSEIPRISVFGYLPLHIYIYMFILFFNLFESLGEFIQMK